LNAKLSVSHRLEEPLPQHSGNRCGHDPAAPALDLRREISPRMNAFIVLFIIRIDDIYWRPHLFPELGAPRSERREALCRLLKRFAYRMDIQTCEVVEPRANGELATIPMRFHKPWTGLSRWRADRAIRHARCSGFLKSSQRRESTKGGPRGLAARRVLTPTLFKRLGLEADLVAAQKEARAKSRTASPVAAEKSFLGGAYQPDVRSAVQAFVRKVSRRIGERSVPAPVEVPRGQLSPRLNQEIVHRSDDFPTAKKLREAAETLRHQSPHLTDDEILDHLDRVRSERMLS
jgi:hypothetical protein